MRKCLILFLFVGFFLFGCSPSKMTFSNHAQWLPADFDPKTGVLLVEEVVWPKAQGQKMKEYMEQNYPYKYAFVSAKELADPGGKYSDKTLYRFAIVNSYKDHIMHEFKPNQITISMTDFNFVDRLNSKTYPKSGKGSSYASVTFKPFINTVLEQTK